MRVISLNLLDAIFMPAELTSNVDATLPWIIRNPTTFAALMTAQAAVIVGLVPKNIAVPK